MTFFEVYDELINTHKHTDLWLVPGTPMASIQQGVGNPAIWPNPKIVTRAGFVVAQRTHRASFGAAMDTWAFTGNYKTPPAVTSGPVPYAAFSLEEYYELLYMTM